MNRNLKIILITTASGRLIFRPFGYNKLLLAVILFALQGMAGFWSGLLVGCALDMQWVPNADNQKKPDLTVSKFMLTAYIVQMSGIVNSISFTELKRRLGEYFQPVFVEGRIAFFNELLKQRIQVDALCAKLNKYDTVEEKNDLIRFFIRLSHAGTQNANRTKAIYYVADKLEIDEEVLRSFQKTPPPQQPAKEEKNYFTILEVNKSVSYTELRKAYHKLAKQYHPDANSGNDQRILNEKFREIKEAYEKIKELNGWK